MPAFQTGPGAANDANVVFAAIAALNLFGFYGVFAFRAAGDPTGFTAFGALGGTSARGRAGFLAREIGCGQRDDDHQQRQQRVLKHHDRRQSGDQRENDNYIEQDGPQAAL